MTPISLGSAIVVVALFAAHGYAVANDKGIERQTEQYDARASCYSKVLPGAGFVIVKEVPGKEGECYWKRVTESKADSLDQNHESVAKTKRDQVRAERLRKRAYDYFRKKYKNEILAIAKESAASYRLYLKKIDDCGTNINCINKVAREQQWEADGFSSNIKGAAEFYTDALNSIRTAPQDKFLQIDEIRKSR